ncbi:Long-chain-fatty-acid--CoA ligase FadD15 [Paraburkholderia caffeinitolerans]|uniref:Long-chain-fatty-acid--CoA ligase FadD15 n=1 Tax=Paraburkholderia caffeinitolerans TaxID=1723730 RepID=A0A6J5FEG8_9BURK|nr:MULTISPECIES: AMP-binding protein [Paraburkholderia]CAB3778489.1 Long-chain-fatty-acid--CoA ligase FadD15 [Paraburkholderia caffeinitolerans]
MSGTNSGTLVHRFLHWESTQPDAVYLTEPTPDGRVVDYTWKEVGDAARRTAAWLSSLNLPPRSAISIVGKNSAHWLVADLAIWMSGHVSVPVYPTISANTARYIFEHCDVRLVFVGKLDGKTDGWNEIHKVIPDQARLVALPMSPATPQAVQWDAIVSEHEPLHDVHLPDADDLATIIYTSGSTGEPKGVMHSFGTIFAYAEQAGIFCDFTPADRVLSYLPLAHTAERSFVESNSLCHGFRVFFNDSLATFIQDLHRARPTVFISMPRLWTKFYQGACSKLSASQLALLHEATPEAEALKKQILTMLGLDATRIAFTGSAPLPEEITNWYRALGLELLDVYGMTENFSYSHYSRPGLVRPGYSGQAMPGVACRIAENGEILLKAPTMMLGYYRQPELSAQSMSEDGFFKTGDRGELDEIGRLKITGRVKEMFKTSKGKYVVPVPIENKLSHPQVEAVCVTGPGFAQPFALLMLSAAAQSGLRDGAAREALRAQLQEMVESVNATLEDHEKLDFVVVVDDVWTTDNGFLTPTMKIKRAAIEDHYLPAASAWAEQGQPVIFDAGSRATVI